MHWHIESFLDHVQDLDDLELAVLLSLVTKQHCLITTETESLEDVASQLSSIVSQVFGLSYAVVAAEDQQSVDKFGAAILHHGPETDVSAHEPDTRAASWSRLGSVGSLRAGSHVDGPDLDQRVVANVVIAKNFNHAHRDVQIAALELIRRRRIFSRTTVHPVPKEFLFIPLVARSSTKQLRLNHHLNDRLFISHHHQSGDRSREFDIADDSHVSSLEGTSSLDRPTTPNANLTIPRINAATIESLQSLSKSVNMTSEIRRYIQDIVVFLRMERGVDGGVSPFATTMLVDLAKSLAALHGIDYVTPSLVGLAARKIYAHRLAICVPERERSLQWQSDVDGVRQILKGLTPEIIIENCLSTVPCPK